jgi:hypothetical protein
MSEGRLNYSGSIDDSRFLTAGMALDFPRGDYERQ